jgi:uncharacterized integral membrane protein
LYKKLYTKEVININNMDSAILLNYFLWFIVVLASLMYLFVAAKNKSKINLEFFGTKKEVNIGLLLIITYFDGLIIGFLIYFLLSMY